MKGEGEGCCGPKGGNERIVSLFAATMHPGVAWHREPGSPVPAAATGAEIRCVSDEHCRDARKRHPLA